MHRTPGFSSQVQGFPCKSLFLSANSRISPAVSAMLRQKSRSFPPAPAYVREAIKNFIFPFSPLPRGASRPSAHLSEAKRRSGTPPRGVFGWGEYVSVLIELNERRQRLRHSMPWVQVVAAMTHPTQVSVVQRNAGVAYILRRERHRPVMRYLSQLLPAVLAESSVDSPALADETIPAFQPGRRCVKDSRPCLRHGLISFQASGLRCRLRPDTLVLEIKIAEADNTTHFCVSYRPRLSKHSPLTISIRISVLQSRQ